MKFNAIHFFVILALSIPCIMSCSKKLKHEDEVKYYVTMQKTRNHQVKSWNRAMHDCTNAYNLSTWDSLGRIPDGRADSAEMSIKNHIACIDTALTEITSVEELDKKIHLKKIVLDYLNHSKEIWQNGMMTRIKMMRKGLETMSEEERIAYNAVSDDIDKVNREAEGMDYYIQEFAIKHKVTSTELIQYNMH